jgi:aminopeptidase YwaD
MRRCFIPLLSFAAIAALGAQPRWHLPPLDRALPPRVETIYAAIRPHVDTRVAMDIVTFMGPLWRLAGNPAYDASIDVLAARLRAGGFTTSGSDIGTLRVESYENSGQGWEHERGTLAIESPGAREVVLSREQDRVALCINSFSTPSGGVSLPLVDVGAGTNARDYEGKDVKGMVVLGSGAIGPLFNFAVRDRGAAGVISSALAPYTRPDETPNVLQWGSIPYNEQLRAFGFKATPRAAKRLRAQAAAGPVRVHVDIATTFHRRPSRTLVAEITGSSNADQRVVLVAHVQEPGANDNASGSATLLSAALAMRAAIAHGALPRPARTLTFMWLDEIRGSERWTKDHPQDAARVVAMMSLDMTGEDTAKTGGTFLIEKGPDPSAIYPRPSDPHSEWGAGEVPRDLVRGHFLNDFHLAVCLRRARDTGWVVRTNPYEGGSDHTVFTRQGVPALLNWHFTDRYYHTNLDTVDKVSDQTMGNVATAVATTAMFLASADETDRAALTKLVDAAERARSDTERANQASDEIMAAWKKWYDEARASIARFIS